MIVVFRRYGGQDSSFTLIMVQIVQEISNIPLEHTPDPPPTVYEGIPFIWGFRDSWGMLQGYVGLFLEIGYGHAVLKRVGGFKHTQWLFRKWSLIRQPHVSLASFNHKQTLPAWSSLMSDCLKHRAKESVCIQARLADWEIRGFSQCLTESLPWQPLFHIPRTWINKSMPKLFDPVWSLEYVTGVWRNSNRSRPIVPLMTSDHLLQAEKLKE